MQIYKEEEWQDSLGRWHCACVSPIMKNNWYIPAKVLEISVAELARLYITEYNAEIAYKRSSLFIATWEKKEDMRRWKKYINQVAKEKNFYII